MSQEEVGSPIAFSMLTYKDIEQFERLLLVIYRPQNYNCVHIDGKSKEEYKRAVEGIAACLDIVFIASKSVDVYWGQYSVLEPEIIRLWKYKKWKYFINLTGQEFPLQTMWDYCKNTEGIQRF